MNQEPQTTNLLITEEDASINPFADFVLSLEGHLTGAPIADGRTVLVEDQTFLSALDEEATMQIIESVAASLSIDISTALTSRAALDLLVPGS